MLMGSLMLSPSCTKETAREILGRTVKSINEVESFHMIVTQTLTTSDETFTLSQWDAIFKREDGVFVVGQHVDPKSKEVTDYEVLFATGGEIYLQPLGSESQWIPVPPVISESMTGDLYGLQSATFGQSVNLQDILQQYMELNRASDERFDGQSVYVLEGVMDVDKALGQIEATLGILTELPEGTKIDWSMTEQIFVRQNDYLPLRVVALSPSTFMVLGEQHEKQEANRALLGIPLTDDDLVFSQLDGKPLLPNTVTHAWIKLVRQAGLKSIRLHDARHTHASIMLKQGIHPKIVQERLGHANIAVTLDTYSHVAPGLQEAAAKLFDDAFTTKYNGIENEAVKNLH